MNQWPIISPPALMYLTFHCVLPDEGEKPKEPKEAKITFTKYKVKKVNTNHLPKKKKRVGKFSGYKPQNKKAIVTLAENDTINLFAEN